MIKCLYDYCSNTEKTPGVKFHEVLDSSEGNKCLELHICSYHLKREFDKQVNPGVPVQQVPCKPTLAGEKQDCAMLRCNAKNCPVSSVANPEVSLHHFPLDRDRFRIWCNVAEVEDNGSYKKLTLCSRHFKATDYSCVNGHQRRNIRHGSNPVYRTGIFNPTTGDYCPAESSTSSAIEHSQDKLCEPQLEVTDVSINCQVTAGATELAESSVVQSSSSPVKAPAKIGAKKNRHCCAAGCPVSLFTHPHVGLFKFHPSNERFEKWCLVADLSIRETRLAFVLCARHFHSGCFVDSERRNLKADSEPMYPTGPLNELTGNYCLYNKEPPLLEQYIKPKEVIVVDDDDDDDDDGDDLTKNNASEKLGELENPEKLQTALAGVPQTADHGYSLLQPTRKDSHPVKSIFLIADKYTKCEAIGCLNSYRNNPSIKFFKMGYSSKFPDSLDKWRAELGGVTSTSPSRFIICQYHFPEKAFIDAEYRTRLMRSRHYHLFPFGPMNPKTKDYCPQGQEELSIVYHKERVLVCCVRGCPSSKPLFKFPYYDDKAFDIWCERVGVCRKRYSREYISNILCICALHFDGRCKVLDTQTDAVFPGYGALPTLKLPNFHGKSTPSTILLKDDTPPPNARELAHSLLLKRNEDVPAKIAIAQINDLDGKAPKKKQKLDVAVKHDVPAVIKMVPSSEGTSPTKGSGRVTHWAPVDSGIPGSLQTPNIFSAKRVYGSKRGPKRKFEPDENRPSMSIKEFLDDFVSDMSPPAYSPPPSPDEWDPNAKTRDASVQTDDPPVTPQVDGAPKNTNKKAKEKLEELHSIDIGNEVDVTAPLLVDKTNDKYVWNQVAKENALERALIGLFNSCKSGGDNAFSGVSDRSTIPEPSAAGGLAHQYSTYETVNVLRSAAQLCEFNTLKVQQLEQLMLKDEKRLQSLEDTLVEHLSAVMCITGVELVKKCFGRVLQDAISREKANEKKGGEVAVQVFDGKKKTGSQIPMTNPDQCYSDETKQMSKALLAYSGRAYVLLRQIADLPQPYLIRNWSTYPDGSPGFSDQAFNLLRQYHGSSNVVRVCSLSVVDVPLRKDVTWDGKIPFGLEDLGFGCVENDFIREATKAVVFCLKFLAENKMLPVGYVLADNLTPQVRANLIIQYICHFDSVGIKCLAVVSDYSVTTYETFFELGAFIDGLDTGWFHHPFGKGVRVRCFTDVFQNLRALSNLWAEKKVFRPSPKAETAIDQDHISLGDAFLNKPQGYACVPAMAKFLSNLKLLKSQAHKDPLSTNKFNAIMLTILRDLGVKKFSSTSQTIKYLESLTAVTDIFSSTHPYDAADRRPLIYSSCSKVQSRLTALSTYFSGLCFGSGTKILATNRKLPVAMLKMNLNSLKYLSKRLFYGEKCKKLEFYCKGLSLEDIDATIATICGGAKRLVSATEFKKGFQKYMDGYDLTPSKRLLCNSVEPFPVTDICLGFKNSFAYEYRPFDSVTESALEFLTENVVETWLEKATCVECSQLVQNGILTFHDYNFEGNVVRDIHKMIRTAETCLAEHTEIPCDSYDIWFNRLSNKIFNSLKSVSGFKKCSHLFVSVRFGEISHFTVLVKDMLRIFLQLRLCFLNREERIKIQAPREHSMKFNLGRSWT